RRISSRPSRQCHPAIMPLFCPTGQTLFGIAEVGPRGRLEDFARRVTPFSGSQNSEIAAVFYCAWGCFRLFLFEGQFLELVARLSEATSGTFAAEALPGYRCAHPGYRLPLDQRVISLRAERQQAEPVPERIGQHGDPPIGRIARRRLQDRAGTKRARDRGVDV